MRKQAGIVIPVSDKVDFKPKLVRRDEEEHSSSLKEIPPQNNII